jgi:ankyrin repeat protein
VIDLVIDFLEQESKLACFLMHTLTYQYGASSRRTVANVPKLQITACFGLKETVKALLEGGADIEARSSNRWTVLSSTAWTG